MVLAQTQQRSNVPNLRGDYHCFYIAYRDAVLSRGENPVSVDDAVFTIELIELAMASAQTQSEMQVVWAKVE